MYLSAFCPYCHFAKRLLKQQGVQFIELSVDFNAAARDEMELRSGRETVPQIFIGQTHVGGYDDLSALVGAGGLLGLLEKERQNAETPTQTPLEND
ncbi:MAG: glutaredoxin 3 [Halothiobacillus sp. 20-53-49]|nr:MAG: glutaredoxin 3 [Halothiobacillus sp. 20-53-49]